jgi:HD superfamily phosphodiesterase
MIANDISGVKIPDTKMARELTQLIRDTENDLLFNHSTRVYLWGALSGQRKGLKFDPELLCTGAMFHDIGLTRRYQASRFRFEVCAS